MAPDGRRIPAAEIERLVADRVCRFLSNGAEIFAAIQDCNHEVTEQKRLVERAAELSKEWRNLSPAQTRSVLRALIARIDLQATNIDIHLASTRLPIFCGAGLSICPQRPNAPRMPSG